MTQQNPLLTQIKNNNFRNPIFKKKPVPLMDLVEEIGLNGIGYFTSDDDEEDQDYTNVLGFVDTEEKLIGINQKESLTTQRFTVAHEIAHLALHSDLDEIIFYRKHLLLEASDLKYLPAIEKEANQLASKILMPEESILDIARINKDKAVSDQIVQVMVKFSVSFTAAQMRLQELGLIE